MIDAPDQRGRVLLLTSNFPRWPGDSTTPFVLHMAQDLQALGWQIDVLAPHHAGARRKECLDGIDVERFRYMWPEGAQTVCYEGGALANLDKSFVNYLKVPVLVLMECLATIRKLRKEKYDVIHGHWILPQGFAGAIASKLLGVPLVLTVHGGDVFALKGYVLKIFKRFALKAAAVVTVNSSATRIAVGEVTHQLARIEKIPMGISERPVNRGSAAEIREKFCSDTGGLVIFLGRLVKEKGAADLVEAMAILKSSCPGIKAIIVGDGPQRADLEALVRKRGLEEDISFPGWIEPESVSNFLAAADVFVGPSRRAKSGWIEAQGLTFLEAMSVETVVVATKSGGIVDTVRHMETGILVDEERPDQIAQAVHMVLADKPLKERLQKKGLETVRGGFLRSQAADSFSQVFHSVVKRQPR